MCFQSNKERARILLRRMERMSDQISELQADVAATNAKADAILAVTAQIKTATDAIIAKLANVPGAPDISAELATLEAANAKLDSVSAGQAAILAEETPPA